MKFPWLGSKGGAECADGASSKLVASKVINKVMRQIPLGKRTTQFVDQEWLTFYNESGKEVAGFGCVSRTPYNRLCELWRGKNITVKQLQLRIDAICNRSEGRV